MDRIGQTISHYRILEKIGEGGMGVVYKAEDLKLARVVALKFLPPDFALDADARNRFVHEARAASALNHTNITTIYEIGEEENQLFIAMEYCEGKTLRQIAGGEPLAVSAVIDIAVQVCQGLVLAHQSGIVHRDIKSDNIMLTSRNQVKIMDFGLAKGAGTLALTKAGSTVGTIGFMAPEQIRQEDVDQRADIWSFGVVLFEMLTGQLPFRGEHEAAVIYSILSESPRDLRAIRPEIPAEISRIVTHCLEKERDARYRSIEDVLKDLRAVGGSSTMEGKAATAPSMPLLRSLKRPLVAVPAALVLTGLVLAVYHVIDRNARVRWALEEALPRIATLTDDRRFSEAYALAEEAEKYAGHDSTFVRLMLQCSFRLTVPTTPGGASVFVKPYAASDSAWALLGTTPLGSVRISREPSRLKVVKPGFFPVELILAPVWDGGSFPANDTLSLTLDTAGSRPERMVRIPGGRTQLALVGLEQEAPIVLGDYFIDTYEVTNREFKKFVDAGGYADQKYWKIPFQTHGRTIPWSEAIALFHDATGRPGPSSWELGAYPEGRGEFPVCGVSWYEAAAYAEYAGKSLPTIYQWNHAAGTPRSVLIVPLGNFSTKGPAPVGSSNSMGPFGTYDMAGNVKEWVWNEARGANRYILGGAWGEPRYMFNDPDAQAPLQRDATFGFRCAQRAADDADPVRAHAPVVFPARNFTKERPVSDNIFAVYRSLYSYDRTELRAVVESRDSSAEYWIRERITFNAAYGNERVIAYLFIPRGGSPPYQTVVYFPGSNALHQRSVEFLELPRVDLIIRSGRAVMYPVYKSTYERGDGLESDVPDTTVSFRDHVIMWEKDCSRSIDYLESRPDILKDRLAYLGVSWGGVNGQIIGAIEHRFKALILVAGGLSVQRSLPEVEQLNFIPRIQAPTLMLNGRFDFFFPVETCQIPMFNLLKMPEAQKRKVVFECGHAVPRVEAAREILDWLDKFLGPAR